MGARRGTTAHEDRRKPGVERRRAGRKNEKSLKILLTENGRRTILPLRQSLPSCERSSVPPLSARRTNCQQGAPVSAQLEKETMNTLELDREVIRCKTCGLVQYRTRTGNCRRCVRALPQRLEFLIPPPAPEEEAAAEPASEKFVNQETVENIGQRIRQLRESRAMTQSQSAIALEGLAVLFVAHRKRADDAEPRHFGEDFRSAERWVEPLLHTGIGRRSAARGSVHPGIAAVPAAIGLGTVAVHPEAPAGDQRPRSRSARHSPPYR